MNTEKLDDDFKNLIEIYKKLLKKLWGFGSVFVINVIIYMVVLWIYLSIYDNYGWERTVISLAVGVIVFSIKKK